MSGKQDNPFDGNNDFCLYQNYSKLQILAQKPYDLTQPNAITPKRIADYYAENLGYRLLYATERVNEEILKALEDLAREARVIEKMQAMQNGEIVNKIEGYPSENRKALHTAVRDLFDHPNPAPAAKEAAALAKAEVDKLRSFLEKNDKTNRYTDLVTVGIGGSDLGPRANYLALEHLKKENRNIHFITNVDPDDAAKTLEGVNLKKAVVVIVSKSGSTLETATNEALVVEKMKKEGLDPKEHLIAVTTPGSPMDKKDKYLEVFYMWDWIGGRYSATSMAGGVLLAFAYGMDIFMEFLKGAHDMDRAVLKFDMKTNLPLVAALLGIWNHNFLGYPTLAIIPYAQPLLRFPAHIQQLAMESNGKRIDRKGQPVTFQTCPIIWGEPGTNGQHSFFQLIHQGTGKVPLCFIGYEENEYGFDLVFRDTNSREKLLANLFAQALALAMGEKSDNPNQVFPGNRPSHILLAKKLTPHSLGALLAFFEHMVDFQGFIWNINSFDQEGVQLGKTLATKITNRFALRNKRMSSAPEFPLADALLDHLSKLK